MKTQLSEATIRRLPKAELHCHLDGAVRVETIIDLAAEQGIELVSTDVEALRSHVSVDMDCPSLEDYLEGFSITLSVLQKSYAITRAVFEVAQDAESDGVKYLEIRFSPILHTNEGLTLSSVMEAVTEGAALAESRLNIVVRIIVCGMRHLSPSTTKALAEIAWRYRHRGINGFDLAGPEQGFSSKYHKEAFDIIREKLISCTLHSGEGAGPEYIEDAIHFCGANRIGHGTALLQSASLTSLVADKRIPLEVCITSNVQTKAVTALVDHPVRKMFDKGIIVVLCTDNPTVSGVTLSGEYKLAHDTFDFTVEEMIRILIAGFQSAFLEDGRRTRLLADALTQTLLILHEEGYDLSAVVANKYNYLPTGVDVEEVLNKDFLSPYWNNDFDQPDLTLSIIRRIPKTDLHCTLIGSVSVECLFSEVERGLVTTDKFGLSNVGLSEFRKLMLDRAEKPKAKAIQRHFMQNVGQITRAVSDIIAQACAETVTYMELMVRPAYHTKEGLSERQVVDAVVKSVQEEVKKHDIVVSIILYVKPETDDPVAFFDAAQVAVDYVKRGQVHGFGVFGQESISAKDHAYYQSTWVLLRKHRVNVAMICDDQTSIIPALHIASADRLSGAFTAHKRPGVMSHMAQHKIPVELALTDRVMKDDLVATSTNPIELYTQNGVPVTICSFRGTLDPMTRSEMLHAIFKETRMSLSMFLILLGNGFLHNFRSNKERQEMYSVYRERAQRLLNSLGFKFFYKKVWQAPIELEGSISRTASVESQLADLNSTN